MIERFYLHGYPWVLGSLLAGWAVLAALNGRAALGALRPFLTRRGAAALGLVLACALALRLLAFPPRHQVYFDEFVHMDISANMASGVFGESLARGPHGLRVLKVPAWSGGYHLLLGGLFRVTGFSEAAAFRFNVFWAAAAVLMMFFLGTVLFSSQRAGLLGAAFLAALPEHVRFSGTTDLTACSSFWLLGSLAGLALWLRLKTSRAYLLFLATTVYAAHVRHENLALAAFAPALAFLIGREDFCRQWPRCRGAHALFVVFLIPAAGILWLNRGAGLPGFDDSWLGVWENLRRNLPSDLLYLLRSPANAALLAFGLAAGFWRPGDKEEALRLRALAGLGGAFLVLAVCYFRGDFAVGSRERFALPVLLPLIAAAGRGLDRALGRSGAGQAGAWAAAAAFAVLCWPAYGRLPPPRYEDEVRFIREAAAALPRDAAVLCYCPPLILTTAARPAVSALLVLERGRPLLDFLDQGGGAPLVLFKDVWWYKFGDESRRLEALLRPDFDLSPLRTASIDSREYGFYRLIRKAPAGPGASLPFFYSTESANGAKLQ